jgi:glycosyltransferase involved in cell wall biosynthesis
VRSDRKSAHFQVLFYAPWAGTLVGAEAAESVAGGGETQLFLLATGLAGRGLSVAMVVIGDPARMPSSVGGVSIVAQPPRRSRRGPAARASLALGALRSMLGARSEVVIQRNAGSTTAVAALAARLGGARFVYSSASVVDFEFAAFERSALNVRLYEWGLRRAAQIVVQTEEQASLCRDRFGRDPVVIGSIAGPTRPRSGSPEAFLWVGKLQPVKRPEPYLELAAAVPEAQFWMIAVPDASESPELRGRVERGARELPNLTLLEPRSRDGVGELLDRTVAVVNTSEREGLPNVFLEGWARGVPALAFSFDPGGLIARHGLGSFAAGDPHSFAELGRRLWAGRGDQAAVAARCIEYVRAEHDEHAVVDRWLAALAAQTGTDDAARAGSSTS